MHLKKQLVLLCLIALSSSALARPVVCVHGLMATSKSMKPFKAALAPECVYLWNFNSMRGCIASQGEALARYLCEMSQVYPGESIDFVTHSVGALILRSALNHPNCPEAAKSGRAVLIAPPNRGSCLARRFSDTKLMRFLVGPIGRELMDYDECDIIAMGNFPEKMPVLVIAGTKGVHLWFNGETNDEFLMVRETYLNTPYFFTSYPLRHGNLLKSPCVHCITRGFLGCNEEPELILSSGS